MLESFLTTGNSTSPNFGGLSISDWAQFAVAIGTIILAIVTYISVRVVKQASLLEMRKAHYKALIEDSIAKWIYEPHSAGDLIFIPAQDNASRMMMGRIPYFEQAQSHLKEYSFWKSYEKGPQVATEADEADRVLHDRISSSIDNEVSRQSIRFSVNGRQETLRVAKDVVYNLLISNNPQQLTPFRTNIRNPDGAGQVDGWGELDGLDEANKLARVLDSLVTSPDMTGLGQKLIGSRRALAENKKNFREGVQKEVVEEVRLSGYTKMKGKCEFGY